MISSRNGIGKVVLKQGHTIAYREWGNNNAKKILAIHGWLDNANSFSYLGPYLAEKGYHVFAPDLLGHGRSSHLSSDASHTAFAYLSTLREIIDILQWPRNSLVGHSMGGGVASVYASIFAEKIDSLVMIDALGPWPRPASKAVSFARQRIEFEIKMAGKSVPRKTYGTLKDAINARIYNVTKYPGNQTISEAAAFALVSRGVKLAGLDDTVNDEDITDLGTGPVSFCHDLGLMKPLYYYITNEQAVAFMNSIACPSLVLEAERGWPLGDPSEIDSRKKPLDDKGLLTHVKVHNSSHHLHLDPETAPEVAEIINNFLTKTIVEGVTSLEEQATREPL